MKAIVIFSCWAVSAGAVLYMAVNPGSGIVFQSPLSGVAVGLIGLGLIRMAQQQQAGEPAATAEEAQ